jgi:hypothetical protein
MNHWYLTLPSNSSMKVYTENSCAKYTTKIPENIDLNGDWEVALSEIIYPNKMVHVVNGLDCIIRTIVRGALNEALQLPDEDYDDPATLMEDLIKVKGNYFKITYDEKTNEIEMNCNHPYASMVFSKTLASVLGFKHTSFERGKVYRGKVCMGVDPSMMYVYCDLIEHVIVGDTRAPLLRTFGMEKSTNDVVHRNFPNPVYVPVQKKQFDTVEVNIMQDTGEPMPFASGKSLVLLHFRRSTNPYFLLQR